MGFLKKFFKNAADQRLAPATHASSFEQLSEDELEAHMQVVRYGTFSLTEAVRPSYDLQVIPRQGFRHDSYRDDQANTNVPVLMAAASREYLFELFMELIEPLGESVDVVLETSHNQHNGQHIDLYREQIDMPVLKSILWDYEEMLLNDGCTGVAVLNPNIPQEVQFDEHKLVIVYGTPLDTYERIFESHGVAHDPAIKFITEAEHVHSSSEHFLQQFNELKYRLGLDEQRMD